MINKLAVTTIWVRDQNEALRFYTEKLGFEIRTDITSGDYRWLTVGLSTQPDLEFQLAALKPGGGFTQEDVDHLTQLVDTGKLRLGPWKTDNCQETYETLSARGVDFVQPPVDRPYGIIEAVFRDNSGNLMLLVQDK
ncbi:VOC family protein [Anaerolineae bacterium CFX9]|nr:VOC family protein [Oscillatoria laete-virens]MDL1900183.1 VOC family protein [Anaerolineae bacterium CFX9]MDL5054587.1 VOC family protein [Oscillatoria laete-virens NRMC-F 0139]